MLSFTCLFCPILWALAWACRSFWGFQSESKMTTVSADARLIPRPPARVDNKKQKSWAHKGRFTICYSPGLLKWSINCVYCIQGIELTSEPSALKWSNACFLISPLMEPSNLYKNLQFFKFRNLWLKCVDGISSFLKFCECFREAYLCMYVEQV